MAERATNRALTIVAILTLVGSVLGGAVTAAFSYGGVSTRVEVLEKSQPISREEWNEFRDDLKQRLDRIEDKLDKEARNGK